MDSFDCGVAYKVDTMHDSSRNDWLTDQQHSLEPVFDDLNADDDLLMEHILQNMNSTPLGQVLKKIAALPDVRRNKVLKIRRQISQGRYDVNERLDLAMEKVLGDLDF